MSKAPWEGMGGYTNIDSETLPEGVEQTLGTNPTVVTVPPGGVGKDVDAFKPIEPGTIEHRVFQDSNENGTDNGSCSVHMKNLGTANDSCE